MTASPQQARELPPIHRLAVDEVRESARNPRKIPDAAVKIVAESIRRFGWKQPLVVDADHTLIAGHTRHRAARLLGLTHVPAVIASDLTPEEVNAYRIADNRSGDFTSWDLPELAQQLAELEDDFADVLALADWEAVTAQLQEAQDLTDLDLPGDASALLKGGGFAVTVFFQTKEDALAGGAVIIDLPGVSDVRNKF